MQRMLPLVNLFVTLVLIVSLARADVQRPSAPSAALGSAFTYQGELRNASGPVNGRCDLEFSLWDAAADGTRVAGPLSRSGVVLTQGRFSVQLDFGSGPFTGEARYLESAVRCPAGTDSYTTLSPRQALSAAPYALHAQQAGTALTVPWTGITGVPAGFADGADNDTTYTPGTGLALSGTQFRAQGSPYGNVVVVAKSGGDYTSIQAALDSITATASNPYLVYVAPGVYVEKVTLKAYVTLEGAGAGATIIRWTGGQVEPKTVGGENPTGSSESATLVGTSNATLRHLTVESIHSFQGYAVAVWNKSAAPTLSNVTVSASGGNFNYGIYNFGKSAPTLSNVTVSASGGTHSFGVYNDNSAPTLSNVTVSASGSVYSIGVTNNEESTPTLSHVTVSASGDTHSYGVNNLFYSAPTLSHVTVSASGGTSSIGVYNIFFSSVTIRESVITGATNSVHSGAGNTARVANSQLIGPLEPGLTCFQNYDANLASITCP